MNQIETLVIQPYFKKFKESKTVLLNEAVNLVEAIEEMNAHLPGHNNKLSFENYLKDVA